MHAEVTSRLRELHTTNEAGERRRESVLQDIACSLDEWTSLVRKEKGIFHVLNKLSVDVTSKVLIAEAWVPISVRPRLQEALKVSAESSSTGVRTLKYAGRGGIITYIFNLNLIIITIIIEGLSLLQSIPPTTANKQTQAQKKRGSMARKLLGANAKSYRLKLKLN